MIETSNGGASDNLDARKRIGERIAELRVIERMTQLELAELTGLGRPHISRLESGMYSVGFDTLEKIANALGKKVDLI